MRKNSHLTATPSEEKSPHNIIKPYIPIIYVFTRGDVSCWYTPCVKEGAKDSEEREIDFAGVRVYW